MACSETPNKDSASGTYKPTDLPGALDLEDLGSPNEESLAGPSTFSQGTLHPAKEPPKLHRLYESNREAMLAALRVVLGLPRVIAESSEDDLLSDAS